MRRRRGRPRGTVGRLSGRGRSFRRGVEKRLQRLLAHLLGEKTGDVIAALHGEVVGPAEILRRLLEPPPPRFTRASTQRGPPPSEGGADSMASRLRPRALRACSK